nr:MAG TPA: capsid protein [Caudoviricetes sp.]
MANHTHVAYPNFVLANEIEDQYNSHLDLVRFCTVDNSLVGVAGDTKKINVYKATAGTEKLAMGVGNSKNIEVSYTDEEYKILLAQNRFPYYDEEEMKDPLVVQTGLRHMATDMFNTVNKDVFAEFNKATLAKKNAKMEFADFVDAVALLNMESLDGVELFAFVSPADMGTLRKNLKDDLKYVEAFVRQGYIGTVAGVNLYTKKDAVTGTICGGTREAVTLFNKTGTEVEQKRDPNVRLNEVFSRKYYLAALTDATKAFKITTAAE